MAGYELSAAAKARLLDIEAWTAQRFGTYQADAYLTGLQQAFELIAKFNRIGRSADELAAGLRRYRYQSHAIFYSIEPNHVLIRTILHNAQDLRPDLFE
jgi:toxin ParE1/3/4